MGSGANHESPVKRTGETGERSICSQTQPRLAFVHGINEQGKPIGGKAMVAFQNQRPRSFDLSDTKAIRLLARLGGNREGVTSRGTAESGRESPAGPTFKAASDPAGGVKKHHVGRGRNHGFEFVDEQEVRGHEQILVAAP